MDYHRATKRPRLESNSSEDIRAKRSAFLSSLSRGVSPPLNVSKLVALPNEGNSRFEHATTSSKSVTGVDTDSPQTSHVQMSTFAAPERTDRKLIASPFQLLRAQNLPSKDNIDTVSLHDILGDPLIKQAWIFNFCFDVNWTMQHFDADVRELVDVKIVHGSWRDEDSNRVRIEEHLQTWKNVQQIQAWLTDPFGTHHSKMIILFKHDDTAQIIIHTANMLEKDWEHMTQAAWRSPALPLLQNPHTKEGPGPVGSGSRFKHDLLRYVKAYGSRLRPLAEQLSQYDFSQIRAALIASVPSSLKGLSPSQQPWGHLALSNTLKTVASTQQQSKTHPRNRHLVCQVSSIATLPATWLKQTIFKAAASACPSFVSTSKSKLTTSIIYPTPSDLRNAITGYATGGSIHTKTASEAQQKQVSLLRPQLHRWGAQSSSPDTRGGRHLVPPHIKTYICYSSKPTAAAPTPDIEWALLTSANLSTQAWGSAPKPPKGVTDPSQAVVRIQSFEIGVLVWPELFADEGTTRARMLPVFGKDMPDVPQTLSSAGSAETLVGLRMPYDLPLVPYEPDEMPWSPSETYTEPDGLGQKWD